MNAIRQPPKKPSYGELLFQPLGTPPKPHVNVQVEGWDTETPTSGPHQGRADVLAHSGAYHQVSSFEDCINLLLARRAQQTRNVWWNLDYDVTAILKHRPETLEPIYETNQADVEVNGKTLSIFYLPKKLLKLTYKNSTKVAYHYDIMQFYRMSLAAAASRYLNREAHDLKSERSDWSDTSDARRGVYCQWDARATRDLGILYLEKLHDMNLYPKHLISPGNLAEQFTLAHADVPTYRDVPYRANAFAWSAYRGGWFDAWTRGTEDVWKWDIVSAYPSIMAQLPDFREGAWLPYYDADLFVGFHLCRVETAPSVPPFIASFAGSSLAYPTLGEPTRVWLTNPEIRRLDDHPGAVVTPLSGFSFEPATDARPWHDLVQKLLKMKTEAKGDDAAYKARKEVFNSLYGKTCQRIDGQEGWQAGRIFCPTAATMITAGTRCQIFDAVRGNLDHVISIATDSVVADKDLGLDLSSDLGGWELEAEDTRGVFVRSGVYQLEGKRPHTRGFRLPKRMGLFEFCAMGGERARALSHRPLSMREAVHRGRIEDTNVFVDDETRVSLVDHRRSWVSQPALFSDLVVERFDSRPLPLCFLEHPAAQGK